MSSSSSSSLPPTDPPKPKRKYVHKNKPPPLKMFVPRAERVQRPRDNWPLLTNYNRSSAVTGPFGLYPNGYPSAFLSILPMVPPSVPEPAAAMNETDDGHLDVESTVDPAVHQLSSTELYHSLLFERCIYHCHDWFVMPLFDHEKRKIHPRDYCHVQSTSSGSICTCPASKMAGRGEICDHIQFLKLHDADLNIRLSDFCPFSPTTFNPDSVVKVVFQSDVYSIRFIFSVLIDSTDTPAIVWLRKNKFTCRKCHTKSCQHIAEVKQFCVKSEIVMMEEKRSTTTTEQEVEFVKPISTSHPSSGLVPHSI
jgi:hypothetical protein